MAYHATCVSHDPIEYFIQTSDEGPHLRVSDVILRVNRNPKEIFSRMIRLATNSKWSHAALLYLLSDPTKGFDNTFLIEATTKGVRLTTWNHETIPYDEFTVGIKRLKMDWYTETPREIANHDEDDPEDVPGIGYLRHVRGIALDQVNQLFDHKVVNELAALYIERVAERHLPAIPVIAEAAEAVANLFKKWDNHSSKGSSILNFICSGLIQYSFFEALRRRIIHDLAIPEHREAALSNMSNMSCIIFRPDPDNVIPNYIQQLQSGKLNIADVPPDDVLDLLKTAIPADFNNSSELEWRYIIRQGSVWQIDNDAPADYQPQSEEEAAVLELMVPEHNE